MKFYRHWVKEADTIVVDGTSSEITCYGRSDVSLEAAHLNAREQAAKIREKIEGKHDAFDDYEVAIREEIIEQIDPENMISRNRYVALVLN